MKELPSPDQAGPAAEAWCVPLVPGAPAHRGVLSLWLVRAVKAHPYWEWWVVRMLSLKDVRGMGSFYAKAEYELDIYAIDPGACPPDPRSVEIYPELIPMDIVEQFDGPSREQAASLCTTCVRAIVAGTLSPDEEDRPRWGKAVRGMLQHIEQGGEWQTALSS